MSNSKYDIFISYSRKDTVIAEQICSALDANGISYFIDRQGIGGGMEFPEVLADAICDSTIFLYLASLNSYESKFTNSEITFAFNEKPKQSILPYIIDGSEMPRSMRFIFSGINWRNINNHPINTVLIGDLLTLLNKPKPSKAREEAESEASKDAARKAHEEWLLSQDDDSFKRKPKNGKWGYVDKNGDAITSFKYDDASTFSEGLAAVKLNGKWGFIDKTGNEVIPLKYIGASAFSEGLVLVKLKKRYGFIDKTGKEVIPLIYDVAFSFSEGLAFVKLNGKSGFIDKTGEEVIPLKYDDIGFFSEGLAFVKLNEKYGFIDKTGDEVIPLKYDSALFF